MKTMLLRIFCMTEDYLCEGFLMKADAMNRARCYDVMQMMRGIFSLLHNFGAVLIIVAALFPT